MREAILSAPLRLTNAAIRGMCKRSTPMPWMVMSKVDCYTTLRLHTTTLNYSMSAKSPSSKSRGCLASVSTGRLASEQTYLFWLLVLAILHRKIDMTDNHFKRFGRREIKRQERNKRVVLNLTGRQHSTRTENEALVPTEQ